MKIYYWFLLIVCVLYGGLTILAGIVQLKQKKISTLSNLVMMLGGFLVVLISIGEKIFGYFTLYILIFGLLFIHFSAINNGIKLYGKINIKHHLIRGLVSLLIIVLFLLK